MARKLRLEYAGACYHVINRGNYRRPLFKPPGAAESFENCLFEACGKFGWRLHVFGIMSNHFHLGVETPEPNLSEGMKWLQGTWAARFNRFHGEVGRPFQGRYKAFHVEPGHVFAQVGHYIHLNPVTAGIVSAAELRGYRWSSLHWFLSRQRPACLVADTVLLQSGNLSDTPAGWRSYLSYLQLMATRDPKRRDELFQSLCRGWAVGGEEFKTSLARQLAAQTDVRKRFELLGADREAVSSACSRLWEDRLRANALSLKIVLTRLPAAKSAREKVMLAAVMKASTSASNPWLAQRLQMGQPASVTQYVRRFQLRGGLMTPAIKHALSIVHT